MSRPQRRAGGPKVTPAMAAVLCLARKAKGALNYNGGWYVGATKVDGKAVQQLIQADLVEPTRHNDYGSPIRLELNLRGQDMADEAMARVEHL